MVKKRLAEVTLRKESIQRLMRGQTVTIRLGDIELELHLDPAARLGPSGSLEDLIANILRAPRA